MLLFLCALLLTVVGLWRIVLLSCVYFCYLMCIVLLCVYCRLTLVARLLAWSQYPEGRATGLLGIGFSWFRCVYQRMLIWFPRLQVATACFLCRPPDLNFLDPYFIFYVFYFIFMYMHNNHCHRTTAHLQSYYYYYYHHHHLLYAGYLHSYSWDKLCP